MDEQLVRLPFLLPDFTRISWASDQARAIWELRLKKVSTAWKTIELESVRSGIRPSAVLGGRREQIDEQEARLGGTGLVAKVIATTRPRNGYSSCIEAPRAGEAVSFRVAIGRPDSVQRLCFAYEKRDVVGVGTELGYPPCCCDFFQATWVKAKLRDTTWSMAAATSMTHAAHNYSIDCSGHPLANILWRCMGVRAVPHLPCRFDCAHTITIAEAMLCVGRSLGFLREMDDLLSVLSWPVEWSALHGIAEIKTPILKIITRTDSTAYNYQIRRTGTSYPPEGVRGLNFPFLHPAKAELTLPQPSSAGLSRGTSAPSTYANGFVSSEGMNAAHAPIVRAAQVLLDDRGGAVLDLGCGDGALLKKICTVSPGTSPYGLDLNAAAIMAAGQIMPHFAGNFHLGSLWDDSPLYKRHYSLVIVSLQRLDEVDISKAQVLLARLANCSEQILVYQYAESGKHVAMSERAARFGLDLYQPAGEERRVSWARVVTNAVYPT